ncbi:MAG: glutathione-disulfide reductase [Geminicoccaceae bacterium]
MQRFDYDFYVIGAGSGGTRAGRIAAGHGARVAVAERKYLGGTCVNVGCVPKKLMTFAAGYAHHFEDAKGFGWSEADAAHDWRTLIANKDREIERLNSVYQRLITGAGADLHWGDARVIDPHTVEIDGRQHTAERILVATGGRPVLPDIPGVREHGITSDDVFYLPEMPKRVLLVGAGYIGIEFGGIFARLGAEVTLIHRGQLILNTGFDTEVRQFLQDELTKQGIGFCFDCVVTGLEKTASGVRVLRSNGDDFEVDQALFATGRAPNTDGLGLERVGVQLSERGGVIVNEDNQSSVPSIYAIGDVTQKIALTPVATAEGHALADTLFGGKPRKVDYRDIPTAVFANPPVSNVGLTEDEARKAHAGDIDVYKSSFTNMKFTLAGRDERTFMKLIVQRSTDRVVGAHMVGQDAPEIIQGIGIALKAGATKADFDATIGIHPTAAEEFVTMRQKAPDPEAAVQAAE